MVHVHVYMPVHVAVFTHTHVQVYCTVAYLSKCAIKDVHGAVIRAAVRVLNVVLHLHLDRVAIIVFSTLELLVPVLPRQTLKQCEGGADMTV